MNKTDILVIGGGVAGLSFAIWMAEKRRDLHITVLTKTHTGESNTRYAQGGVAAVWDENVDDYQKHIADTLDAGDGLCDEDVVRMVVEEGPKRVEEIIQWGARFDKKSDGKYDLGREGGHSENRILHFKDITGWEIQRTLNEKVKEYDNVTILEHYFAINIITQHHLGRLTTRLSPDIECYGAYALNKESNMIETFVSRVTILATGGAGQVYKSTTNPVIASGDGIAMMYRAKGRVANMEFIQFHPTSLFNPAGENPSFLISEAVRGFGGVLRTTDGKEFMHKYDDRKSLAPRDIVARAIDNEMKLRGDEYVFLDCTHLDKEGFINHFPNIYEKCLSIGIDPLKDFIPVVPACHYTCGGILVDEMGRTSIHHLYAAGECTSSGLHGANRLASNSLLEGLVYGERMSIDIAKVIDSIPIQENIPAWDAEGTTEPREMVLLTQSLKELKEIMSSYVGIVRTDVRLKRAQDRLYLLYEETEQLYNTTTLSPQMCELRNLITIAYLITRCAQMRKESRGLHYNTDHPEQFDYKQNTLL
ncbi:MAG: L-aspartate oxidase [Saprospiraceae bacterium]|nr:L-aspartate oxidase [Saprospiraceae bacterium]